MSIKNMAGTGTSGITPVNGQLVKRIDLANLKDYNGDDIVLESGDVLQVFNINAGAEVSHVRVDVVEPLAEATVKIGDAADDDRYLQAKSIASAGTIYGDGSTGVAPDSMVKHFYASNGAILLGGSGIGSAASGKLDIVIGYQDFAIPQNLNV